jgi:hypothetical protein
MRNFTKLFSLFILIATAVNAQVTIQSSDMPGAGSNYTMSNGMTFPGIDIVSTGANQTWDFTQLSRTGQVVDSVISPSATDPLLALYFTLVENSNLAQKGTGFNLGTTGLSNVFNYYKNSQTDFSQTGIGAVVNALPVPMGYTPHDFVYRFPLNYLNQDSCMYSYELDLSSTLGIFYHVNRARHNEVDGWGTLMTPFGTFQALRIKSTLIEQDSIHLDTFGGIGFTTPPVTTIEYKWLSQGKGLPLLQINASGTNTISSILYQDSTHTIGINEIDAVIENAIVFPNPVSNKFFVKYNLLYGGDVMFDLYSMDGKRIFDLKERCVSGENIRSFNVGDYDISPGNYFLKIHSSSSEVILQVQIQ